MPCQVWTTAFFDKNVVGSANALTAGFGNAGGGVTYFLMPAIFDSLVKHQHLSDHVAWRVTFVVPFLAIVSTAIGMMLFCPDTPRGKWSDRDVHANQNLIIHESHSDESHDASHRPEAPVGSRQTTLTNTSEEAVVNPSFRGSKRIVFSWQTLTQSGCYFCSFGSELAINSVLGAYYLKNFPGLGQTGSGRWAAMFGLLNIIFRPLGGMIADVIYDYINHASNAWGKKIWMHFLGIVTGIFLIVIGVLDSHHEGVMFGLVVCLAFFLEAANGANYALVPHVHPHANGTLRLFILFFPSEKNVSTKGPPPLCLKPPLSALRRSSFLCPSHPSRPFVCLFSSKATQKKKKTPQSNALPLPLSCSALTTTLSTTTGLISGLTGAAGSLGGIIFAIIFRYNHRNYAKAFWIIGIVHIGVNAVLVWVSPIPAPVPVLREKREGEERRRGGGRGGGDGVR